MYQPSPAGFIAYDNSGLIYEYTFPLGAPSPEPLGFLLERLRDRNGNQLTANYQPDGAPYSLTFPGGAVLFEYETRLNALHHWIRGQQVDTTQRLKRIRVQGYRGITGMVAPWLLTDVRQYNLSYKSPPTATSDEPALDILASVQECARGVCREPLILTTTSGSSAFEDTTRVLFQPPFVPVGTDGEVLSTTVADYTGDGRPELVYARGGTQTTSSREATWHMVAVNPSAPTSVARSLGLTMSGPVAPVEFPPTPVDIDNDGRPEILGPSPDAISARFYDLPPTGPLVPRGSFEFGARALLGDFDGDGDVDVFDGVPTGTTRSRPGRVYWNDGAGAFSSNSAVASRECPTCETRDLGSGRSVVFQCPGTGSASTRRHCAVEALLEVAQATRVADEHSGVCPTTGLGGGTATFTITGDPETTQSVAIAAGVPRWSSEVVSTESFVFDLDGDGRVDVLHREPVRIEPAATACSNSTTLEPTPGQIDSRLRVGGGVPRRISFTNSHASARFETQLPLTRHPVTPVDANGDGVLDILEFAHDTVSDQLRAIVYAGRGNGTFESGTVAFELPVPDGTPAPQFILADIDGDGRDDALDVSARAFRSLTPGRTLVTRGLPSSLGPRPETNVKFADVDGDGLLDLVFAGAPEAGTVLWRRHLGSRPGLLTGVAQGSSGATPLRAVRATYGGISETAVHVPRAAGSCPSSQMCVTSGMLVVTKLEVLAEDPRLQKNAPAWNTTTYSYEDGRIDRRGRGWLGFRMRRVTNPMGFVSTEEYPLEPSDVRAGPAGGACNGRYVYAGRGQPKKTTSYGDIRQTTAVSGHFRRTTVERSVDMTWLELQSAGLPGCAVFTSGTTSRSTVSEAAVTAGAVVPGTYLDLTSTMTTSTMDWTGTEVGVTSDVWQGGFVGGQPPASPVGGKKRRSMTRTLYPANMSEWIIGLPQTDSESVVEDGPAWTRSVGYTFWPQSYLEASRTVGADLPAETPTTPGFLRVTTNTRDAYGNVVSQDDSSSGVTRHTEFIYDSSGRHLLESRRFPNASTTQYLSQGQFIAEPFGAPAEVFDENGVRTRIVYDDFGRVRARVDGAGGSSPARQPPTTVSYGRLDGLDRTTVTTLDATLTSASAVSAVIVHDFVGRSRREYLTGPGRRDVVRLTTYDRYGRSIGQSLPAFTTQVPAYVYQDYDRLGRVVSRSSPAAQASELWAYSGLSTTHCSAAGRCSRSEVDALGRLVRSINIDNDSGQREVATNYFYGAFGQLAEVRDPLGRATSFGYDALGRRTSTTDMSTGTTSIHYNGFGEPKLVTDGLGRSTANTYDRLGRVVSASYGGLVETFEFDTAPGGKGRLARAVSESGVETTLAYDSLGRVNAETTSIPTSTDGTLVYTQRQTFDAVGRLSTVEYPDNSAVLYVYGTDHLLSSVWEQTSGGNPLAARALLRVRSYNAAGQVLQEETGDNFVTRRVFDSAQRLIFNETKDSSAQPTKAQALKYEFNALGQLAARHDLTVGLTERYAYDFVDRLKSWKVEQREANNAACRQVEWRYTYDDAGNLLNRQRTDNPQLTIQNWYGSPYGRPANALAYSAEGFYGPQFNYTYDAAGNQTDWWSGWSSSGTPIRHIDYNRRNLPTRVAYRPPGAIATTEVSYKYDASGRRVLEARGGQLRVTLGEAYEQVRQAGVHTSRRGVVANGKVFVQLETVSQPYETKRTFIKYDALGSLDALTRADPSASRPNGGVVDERAKYEPFGQRRDANAVGVSAQVGHSGRVGFTGHQADEFADQGAQFGLTNMRGRLFDQRVGRFVSADPIVSATAFGQAWNRYSYVWNAPTLNIDPTGNEVVGLLVGTVLATAELVKLALGALGVLAIVGVGVGVGEMAKAIIKDTTASPRMPEHAPTGSGPPITSGKTTSSDRPENSNVAWQPLGSPGPLIQKGGPRFAFDWATHRASGDWWKLANAADLASAALSAPFDLQVKMADENGMLESFNVNTGLLPPLPRTLNVTANQAMSHDGLTAWMGQSGFEVKVAQPLPAPWLGAGSAGVGDLYLNFATTLVHETMHVGVNRHIASSPEYAPDLLNERNAHYFHHGSGVFQNAGAVGDGFPNSLSEAIGHGAASDAFSNRLPLLQR